MVVQYPGAQPLFQELGTLGYFTHRPKQGTSIISSLLRHIRSVIHLQMSCTASHMTPGGILNLSAQHCRDQARTKVFPFLFSQKSLVLVESLQGKEVPVTQPWKTVWASCKPDTSSWTVSSWKDVACHWASCCTRAMLSSTHRFSMNGPKLFPSTSRYGVLNHLCLCPVSGVLYRVWSSPSPEPCSTGSLWLGSAVFLNTLLIQGGMMPVAIVRGKMWGICSQGSRRAGSVNPLVCNVLS